MNGWGSRRVGLPYHDVHDLIGIYSSVLTGRHRHLWSTILVYFEQAMWPVRTRIKFFRLSLVGFRTGCYVRLVEKRLLELKGLKCITKNLNCCDENTSDSYGRGILFVSLYSHASNRASRPRQVLEN